MNKQVMLFAFLMMFVLIKGNSQNEWSPIGATWHYGFSSWMTNGYTKISYIGDTIINTISCKIMEKKIFQFNPLSQFDTLTLNHEYTYADNNKVYIFRFNKFYTLYDFAANVGDSIIVAGTDYYSSSGCDSVGLIRVDSIGTMIIDGNSLRYISVSPIANSKWGWAGRIVEKIGPIYSYQNNIEPFNYLFPNKLDYCGMNIDQPHEGGFLRCYSDQSGFTYSQLGSSPDCDYIFTNLNENTNFFTEIKIAPNPTRDILTIYFILNSKKAIQFELFDIAGNLKLSEHIPETISNNKSYNLSGLASGIYYIKLKSNQSTIIKKICKY